MRSKFVCVLVLLAAPAIAETPVTADLSSLSAEAKQELLKKKERFEQLSPDEQTRLRKFHAELAGSPDGNRLQHVLTHYHDWLRTLKPLERDELLSLPAEERIERIRKLMAEQEKTRFRQMADNVPPEDLEAILKWLEDFAESHRERILENMPPDMRRRFEEIEEPARRRGMLVFAMRMRGPGAPNLPPLQPTQEDFNKLVPRLSAQSQEMLKKTPQSGELVKEWIRAAVASKWNAQISNEKLSEFFRDLPATERQELEKLPADELRGRLIKLYFASQQRRDGGRPWLPPGPGGDGRGPSPFVRPDGGRPTERPSGPPGENDPRRFRGGRQDGPRPEFPRPDGPRPEPPAEKPAEK